MRQVRVIALITEAGAAIARTSRHGWSPFFKRGGDYDDKINAGVFYFYNTDGSANGTNGYRGFRPVLCVVDKESGEISYETTSVTKQVTDGAFRNVLTNTGDGAVTYTSSNTSVATVDSVTGEVTIVGAGTTTITATVEDSANCTYATKTASYTLNVSKASISPSVTMGGYTYGGTISKPTVTGNTGNGTVTYYYNTSNSNSGGTKWENMTSTSLNAGEYYMYAVVGATTNYSGATTATKEFTVSKADGSISYATTSMTKQVTDGAFRNELTNTGDGAVTYTSSDTSVATVDSTGEVTMVGAGSTTITATASNGTNYTYSQNTATYTLKVRSSTAILSKANGPVLGTGMEAVYWDSEGNEQTTSSFVLSETNKGIIYNTTLYNYYNYEFDDEMYENKDDTYGIEWPKQPRWANAKTTDDGSYWVWIPRYAYKITYYEDEDRTILSTNNDKTQYGYIDVIFLKGTSDDEYEDENEVTHTGLPSGYKVHPAFQAMTTTEDKATNPLGKWDKELEGIWVAKFEASREDSTDSGVTWKPTTVSYGGGNNATVSTGTTRSRVVSKPSVTSWRNITASNIYQNCLNMNTTLNTHQMKNSEWGAVAYLTYSVYGRNGNELSVNQCGDVSTWNLITGAGPSADGVYGSNYYSYSADTFNSTYGWKTERGKLASTTGNVYGVYDMSGGAYERTASYLYNNTSTNTSSNNLYKYGSNLVSATTLKYKQIYESTVTNASSSASIIEADYELCKNKNGNLRVYGDAVYETSTSYSSGSGSWCSEYSIFPYGSDPFFVRGGHFHNASDAGVFFFNSSDGGNYITSGFRPVVCVSSGT